jgi:hypothetical protein
VGTHNPPPMARSSRAIDPGSAGQPLQTLTGKRVQVEVNFGFALSN